MAELTNHQLEQITKWIQSFNIKYYDVQLELVDHIASAVEKKIDNQSSRKPIDLIIAELKEWPFDKINELIKKKKHFVYWSWERRLGTYLLDYFRLPKIIILLALTGSMSMLILNGNDLIAIIENSVLATSLIYFTCIFYGGYNAYKSSLSYPPPLLTSEAYYKTIGGMPMIPYFIFQFWGDFDFTKDTEIKIILASLILAFSIILLHAFFFVFPKQLKEDTLSYYQHLTKST